MTALVYYSFSHRRGVEHLQPLSVETPANEIKKRKEEATGDLDGQEGVKRARGWGNKGEWKRR